MDTCLVHACWHFAPVPWFLHRHSPVVVTPTEYAGLTLAFTVDSRRSKAQRANVEPSSSNSWGCDNSYRRLTDLLSYELLEFTYTHHVFAEYLTSGLLSHRAIRPMHNLQFPKRGRERGRYEIFRFLDSTYYKLVAKPDLIRYLFI